MSQHPVNWMDQTTLQGILAAESETVFLYTLKITHSMIDTVRVVNDTRDLQRDEGLFLRFPFDVKTPAASDQQIPQLHINIDIVDYRIITIFRSLRGSREKPKLTIERVTKQSPNQVMYRALFDMSTFKTQDDVRGTIQADLLPGALNNAYPKFRNTPSNAGEDE